jgi:hypothetical protein
MLDGKKGIAELDRGGAGQDKAFWEDVALKFNDYSPQKGSYGALVVTSAYDKRLFSEKMWTPPSKEEQINHGNHLGASTFLYRKITRKKLSGLKPLATMKVTSMIFVTEALTRTAFISGSSYATQIS